MKKYLNAKTLLIVQTIIICALIVVLCVMATKKTRIVETKVVTSIPIFEETINCQNKLAPTKNILFIGNSITWHETFSSWWGRWGMAASKKENDYVHQTSKMLSEKYNLRLKIAQFFYWEAMSHDRAETLQLLQPAMDLKYDYIVIQLGENVFDKSTIKVDFQDLINYLKKQSPDAQIAVVGQYWENKEVENAKKELCQNNNLAFVDLSELQDEKLNAGIGTIVFDDDGNQHEIDANGVARHPGDKAMNIIADKIFAILE